MRFEPPDILALSLKPNTDGKAWIVRLYGASEGPREARLVWAEWAEQKAGKIWLSNLAEEQLAPAADSIRIAPSQLVTLRVERV